MSKNTNNKRKKSLKDFFLIVLCSITICIVLRGVFIQPYLIPSGSMENTLEVNDHIVASTFSLITGINRGDIVVFSDPGGWLTQNKQKKGAHSIPATLIHNVADMFGIGNEEYIIKRVIGLPGDVVECKGEGEPLMINGKKISEPYLSSDIEPSQFAFKVTVSENCYFVLGDNRENSADSRFTSKRDYKGLVPKEYIIAKAFGIMLPLDRISFLRDETKQFAKVDK